MEDIRLDSKGGQTRTWKRVPVDDPKERTAEATELNRGRSNFEKVKGPENGTRLSG